MVKVQSIQPTPNPNEFKFVCDEPLVEGSKRLASATEAGDLALAQQLFGLAGVAGLHFEGRSLTVEMTADADWRAVHEGTTRALEAAAPAAASAPAPAGADVAAGAVRVERVESTPNPNAFKLICDGRLYDGTRNYATAADAAGHELAEKVFAVAGVDTVFLCDHFMTVSVLPGTDLSATETAAREIIQSTPSPLGAKVPPPGASTSGFDPGGLADDQREIYERINGLLDERVRPALAGDGGGLEVVGLEGKTLLIRYQGACGSCPSSIAGTLMAIQNLLQAEIDEELSVVSS